MSTRKTPAKKTPAAVAVSAPAAAATKTVTAQALATSAPEPTVAAPAPITSTPAPAASPSATFVKLPPALTNIPAVPEGSTNANGVDYRAALPKNLELSAMPDVLEDLARFSDYTDVFGKTAPPLAYVIQTFTAAAQWSAMRVRTAAWDLYSRTQEGAAWTDLRQITATMGPALDLAVRADATIARQHPAVVRMFDAKRVIAQRGVATKKANKKDEAEGKPPSRGRGAKAAKKAKTAAAELAAAGLAGVAVAPVAVAAAAPVVAPSVAEVVTAAPIAAAATRGTSGATNGAAHS